MKAILRVAGNTGRLRYMIGTIDEDADVVREIPEGESYFDTLRQIDELFAADGFVNTAAPGSATMWEHPEDIRVSRRFRELDYTVPEYIAHVEYNRQFAESHGGSFGNVDENPDYLTPEAWLIARRNGEVL